MNKEKKFKIPSKVINKVKKEYKKNKVLVVLLRMNRAIDFIVAQQVAGMVPEFSLTSSKVESTRTRTLCAIAIATERVCKTFEPL